MVNLLFDPATKPIVILRADAALGKGAALMAVMHRLLTQRPEARLLCLVRSAAVRCQLVDKIGDLHLRALNSDRYMFRTLLDASTSQTFWPAGHVVVMNRSLAMEHDIASSLAIGRWDLLVADARGDSGALLGSKG